MAARRRVAWTEQARRSLDDILSYIARDSPDSAARFLARALHTASTLDVSSERGRIVPELEDPRVRELFVHRYRLIYEVGTTEVTILAFLHGSRDFAKWRHGE